MFKGKLSSYNLMIVSKYFETIQDFINLELSTPKCKGNISKFHFNPIPLDMWSRQFWTSLQTLHLYSKNDHRFRYEQFHKRIIWYDINYFGYEKVKKPNEEYKSVFMDYPVWNKFKKIPEGVTKILGQCIWGDQIEELVMPNSVTSIEQFCIMNLSNLTKLVLSTNLKRIGWLGISDMYSLKEIEIPESVTYIEFGFLNRCDQLTSITMPQHWERVGNRFFNNKLELCSFTIPPSVRRINGLRNSMFNEIEHFIIPSHVTKLCGYCFGNCTKLTSIIIPTSVLEICDSCFYRVTSLKSITIPTSVTKMGHTIFDMCSSLTSINYSRNN